MDEEADERVKQKLGELIGKSASLRGRLAKLLNEQGAILTEPKLYPTSPFGCPHYEELKSIYNDLGVVSNRMNMLYSSWILPTEQQMMYWNLNTEVSVVRKQLELLIGEWDSFFAPPGGGSAPGSSSIKYNPGALVIIQQPFPNVFSKRDEVQLDRLVVQLLMPSKATQIERSLKVKAHVESDTSSGTSLSAVSSMSGSGEKKLEGDTQEIVWHSSPSVGFPLVFAAGTRKDCAVIRFTSEFQYRRRLPDGSWTPGQRVRIESDSSHTFVVMTNQKQWDSCEGLLLKKIAFRGALEISWSRFANCLGQQFLRYTKIRSPGITSFRPLSSYDFAYLNQKWTQGAPHFTVHQFEEFWRWFGACCHTLKYQRHLSALWHKGYVVGFVNRDDLIAALSDQPPGTILIRFSERHSGQLGISHVTYDSPPIIKHYLVQHTDISGNKVTLADFIRYQTPWTGVLQYSWDHANKRPRFLRVAKHTAFEPFYSKSTIAQVNGSGYDPL